MIGSAWIGIVSTWSSSGRGWSVEYEHGSHDPQTDVTGDDPVTTGKIALAHMKEFPDYYDRLRRMEQEAERDWAAGRETGDTS